MNDNLITICFKNNYKFNEINNIKFLNIIKKYNLNKVLPFSHSPEHITYNGYVWKTNKEMENIIDELFNIFKDNVLIFYSRVYYYDKKRKKVMSYNEKLYSFYNVIKAKFPYIYIQLNKSLLGCKFNKEDKYYLIYISENSNSKDSLTVAFRKDVNDKSCVKEEITDINFEIEKKIVDFLNKSINNKPNIIEKNIVSKGREEKIFNKIVFPNNINKKCEEFFNKLSVNSSLADNEHRIYLKLNKAGEKVICDSSYEKTILKLLDNCNFVKRIKTQSMIIDYHKNGKKVIRHYIPDIQILLNDNSFAIIEVKPKEDMIKVANVKKYYALKEYCELNGYGYAMIDFDKTSFEDIINTKVDKEKSTKFLTYMKNNKIKSLDDCDNFRNTNHISKMEMFKIIIEHPQKLKYQGYKLYYK